MNEWFYFLYFFSIGLTLFIGFIAFLFSNLGNDDTWVVGNFWQNCKDTIKYCFGEKIEE